MGHSQPLTVGNDKGSKGGRNHSAKAEGDVLREDTEIMPGVRFPSLCQLFSYFTLILAYGNQDMIPNGKHKIIKTHFPAQSTRVSVEEIRE